MQMKVSRWHSVENALCWVQPITCDLGREIYTCLLYEGGLNRHDNPLCSDYITARPCRLGLPLLVCHFPEHDRGDSIDVDVR